MDKVTDIGSQPKRRKRSQVARTRTSTPRRSREYWEKATQAYELKVGGKLPAEIAEILNVAHVDDVYRMLNERLAWAWSSSGWSTCRPRSGPAP